jgi:hypothetical protein
MEMGLHRHAWGSLWFCGLRHTGTNYELVLKRDKKGRVMGKLLDFMEVIDACQNEAVTGRGVISKPLVLNQNQKKAIEFMRKDLRNMLEHYIPCSRSLEIHGLSEMVVSYFEIIEILAGEPGNMRWKDDEVARIKALCNSGKQLASSTKIHLEISETMV